MTHAAHVPGNNRIQVATFTYDTPIEELHSHLMPPDNNNVQLVQVARFACNYRAMENVLWIMRSIFQILETLAETEVSL